MRASRWLLILSAALTCGVIAACDGGDDDDNGSPTPSPVPFVPIGCQIVWITRDPPTQTAVIDYYVVDAPVGKWVTGTNGFYQGDTTGATNVTGAFVDDFVIATRIRNAAIVATSGTFTITLDATAPTLAGNAVHFSDTNAQQYFLIDTAGNLTTPQGASGVGSFDGEWSVPESSNVAEGSGTVAILYQGSNLTMGSDLAYALCYDEASAFAAMTRDQKILEAGIRAGEIVLSR